MQIIVVNERILAGQLLTHYISSKGHEVNFATSTANISNLLRILTPDLILLDHEQYYKESLEWIKELATNSSSKPLSVVLIVPHSLSFQFTELPNTCIKGIIKDTDEIDAVDECIRKTELNNHQRLPRAHEEMERQLEKACLPNLTSSEREVANRILLGQSTKEIAAALFRSIETIQNHRKAIRQKLGIAGGKHALLGYLMSKNRA